MENSFSVAEGVFVIPSQFSVPGLGIVPVNTFVIKAKEPVLVDTGLRGESDSFMERWRSLVDPEDLKWVWLTHTDQDHIGSIHRVLQEAPNAKVITTFLGVGKMSLSEPLPMDRVYLLNPGQSLSVGDRTLTAVKPPLFDAPETTGLYDDKSGAFFSSDCFGAVLDSVPQDASDINPEELVQRQTLWATIDAPWLHLVDKAVLGRALNQVKDMSASWILSSHLPPARGMTDTILKTLSGAPEAAPFVGPDQAALEAMLSKMTGGQ